jgi:hypothetical protein
MATTHPGITGRKANDHLEPLLVRPRNAWRMLGCGNTHGYALLNAGELESFIDGRARKITVESIHRYIGRKLASAGLTNAGARTLRSRDVAVGHANIKSTDQRLRHEHSKKPRRCGGTRGSGN